MYKIGYIDDQPTQYDNYRKKIRRRFPDVDLVLFDNCTTREEFLERIYEERADVLLIDYKMAATFGFDGSTLGLWRSGTDTAKAYSIQKVIMKKR